MSGKSSWSNFPTPDFTPSITLAPSLQNQVTTSQSSLTLKPLSHKHLMICSLICASDSRVQPDPIKRATGSISPSTFAFRNTADGDLCPTLLDSSTNTVILLLLYFFYCSMFSEVPVSSVRTHDQLINIDSFDVQNTP